MKKWEQIIEDASILINFLENGKLYSKPYKPDLSKNYLVITDIELAVDIATGRAGDIYFDREYAFESNFPDSFVWYLDRISTKLEDLNFFNFGVHGFDSLKERWIKNQIDIITETMNLDIEMIFKCYANEYFTELWKEILEIYMNDGFPCGWEGEYPEGRLVVFSNE